MSVGFPRGKAELDFRAGNLVVTLRDTFEDIRHLKALLDTMPDADLLAMGYVQGEVNVLKSAYAALVKLANVATAQDTAPVADDFMFFARQLTGVQ